MIIHFCFGSNRARKAKLDTAFWARVNKTRAARPPVGPPANLRGRPSACGATRGMAHGLTKGS
eukprot:274915-Alexandrium_andersonii.AAC.1